MSYVFDGANDHIDSGANDIPEIDQATFSWFLALKVSVQPVGTQTVAIHGSAIAPGFFTRSIQVIVPGTSGFRMKFNSLWGTTDGQWEYQTDMTLDAWHTFMVTYNRGATTNDPIFYVDGSAVTVTEVVAPAGSTQTGDDNIRFGENMGGGEDYAGKLAQVAFWSGILTSGNAATVHASSPSAISTNRQYYLPFISDAVDTHGNTVLTVTGATLDAADNPYSTAANAPSVNDAVTVAEGTTMHMGLNIPLMKLT